MKNGKQLLKILTSTIIFVLAIGCAKYEPRSLPEFKGEKQKVEDVKISKKVLNEKETRKIFGKTNSLKLSKKGYETIILNIKNRSDKNYVLNSDDINLNIENPSKIAKILHRDTTKRITYWCIGGLFLWPLFIGAALDGPASKNYNKELNQDMDAKAIYPHEKIKIRSNYNSSKIIFVNKNNKLSKLNLKLIYKKDPKQSIKFTV